ADRACPFVPHDRHTTSDVHRVAHRRGHVSCRCRVDGGESRCLSSPVSHVLLLGDEPAEVDDSYDEHQEQWRDESELNKGRAALARVRPHQRSGPIHFPSESPSRDLRYSGFAEWADWLTPRRAI